MPDNTRNTRKKESGPMSLVDDDVPWPGPGMLPSVRGPKYKKRVDRHNRKIIRKSGINTKGSKEVTPQQLFDATRKRLVPFEEEFENRLDSIQAQMPRAKNNMDLPVAIQIEIYERLDEKLGVLLDDVKKKLQEHEVHAIGYFPSYFAECLKDRVYCFRQMVDFSSEDDERNIYLNTLLERTEEALPYFDLNNALVLCKEDDANSTIPSAADTDDYPLTDHVRMAQASALFGLGMYKEARKTLDLLHAFIRVRDPADQGDITENKVIMLALRNECLLAWKKKGQMRPLFTNDERLELMKRYGVGEYDTDHFKCSYCGALDWEDNVHLCACANCTMRWYCNVECQDADWNSHKSECKLAVDPHSIADHVAETVTANNTRDEDSDDKANEDLDNFVGGILGDGVSDIYMNKHLGPMALMYDESKGEFFECFRDVDLREQVAWLSQWTPENTKKKYRAV